MEMEEDDSHDSPPSDVTELLQRKEPQILVNALTIVVGFKTMRIAKYHLYIFSLIVTALIIS